MDYFLLVGAVIVYVENRVECGVEYAELGNSLGFSLPHIRAVFVKVMGRSLARYVMSRRIAHAAFDAVHTDDTLYEIALRYGFGNPDTFTRAFRRETGLNPKDFRAAKPTVGGAILCAGVYGVAIKNNLKRVDIMNDGNILLGVPRARYGAFGGCTPLPICMKAAANYMGMDLDYDDALVSCGAAFRLTWDTDGWNAGNVDAIFTFDEETKVYRAALESMGSENNFLRRTPQTTKDEFINFIKVKIDDGIPVIALGIVGPPEACVITGYRDGGQTLLGWNCFQDTPEFAGNISFDESGYFITSEWWENPDTIAVMAYEKNPGERYSLGTIIENAIEVLSPRMCGSYAKGIAAYDAWKKALLDESQFAENLVIPLKIERLMCHGDAMDCLHDGRANAWKYFEKLAEKNPSQPLYAEIAKQFGIATEAAGKMYELLGGWERGEAQMNALMKPETRKKTAEQIDICKAADEKALALLKELQPLLL